MIFPLSLFMAPKDKKTSFRASGAVKLEPAQLLHWSVSQSSFVVFISRFMVPWCDFRRYKRVRSWVIQEAKGDTPLENEEDTIL